MLGTILALLLLTAPTCDVTKDKEELSIQDKLHVTVQATFDEGYTPLVEAFIERFRDSQSFGNFSCLSAVPTIGTRHLQIAFELEPLRLGTLYFAPGLLTFTKKDAPPIEVLTPGFEIPCKRQFAPITMAPPLPVHPELAITMSRVNLEMSQRGIREEMIQDVAHERARSIAWVLSSVLLFIFAGATIAFLLVREWRRLFPKPKEEARPVDFNAKIAALAKQKADFFALSALLRELLSHIEAIPCEGKLLEELVSIIEKSSHFSGEEKKELEAFFAELSAIEFMPDGEHPEAWERAGHILELLRRQV
jgi:hypothetical protein